MSRTSDRARALLGVVFAAGCFASLGAACPRGSGVGLGPSLGTAPLLFTMPDRPRCEGDYDAVVDVAVVGDRALQEISGLATSVQNPELLWGIADADNGAVVVGVSATSGATRLTVTLPVDNIDFEDVQTGPCPDVRSACVYVADTGDNDANRPRAFLYAFPEPVLSELSGVAAISIASVVKIPVAYDGGAVDVEAIAVAPDGATVLFFEKTTEALSARIFALRAPYILGSAGDVTLDVDDNVLAVVGSVTAPVEDAEGRAITAATWHWSGKRLALRFDAGVAEYEGVVVDDFFAPAAARVVFPINNEGTSGESIAYGATGTDLYTIAEAASDEVPVLHRSACR